MGWGWISLGLLARGEIFGRLDGLRSVSSGEAAYLGAEMVGVNWGVPVGGFNCQSP